MSYREHTDSRIRLIRVGAELRDLADWEPVGSRLEDLKSALGGVGGISELDLKTLVGVSRIWSSLDPRLKEMYRDGLKHRHSRAFSAALMRVVGLRRRTKPPGPEVYGALRDFWVEKYGYPPSIEIIPFGGTSNAT